MLVWNEMVVVLTTSPGPYLFSEISSKQNNRCYRLLVSVIGFHYSLQYFYFLAVRVDQFSFPARDTDSFVRSEL